MEPYIIVISILIVVAIAAVMIFKHRSKAVALDDSIKSTGLSIKGNSDLSSTGKYEMTVQFDELPALTETEEVAKEGKLYYLPSETRSENQ